MWVPVPGPEELTTQQEVLFKGMEKILGQPLEASRTVLVFVLNRLPLISAYYLPKDGENYQFCYVDEDGKVRGASTPFQFCSKSEEDMLIVTTQVCNLPSSFFL